MNFVLNSLQFGMAIRCSRSYLLPWESSELVGPVRWLFNNPLQLWKAVASEHALIIIIPFSIELFPFRLSYSVPVFQTRHHSCIYELGMAHVQSLAFLFVSIKTPRQLDSPLTALLQSPSRCVHNLAREYSVFTSLCFTKWIVRILLLV